MRRLITALCTTAILANHAFAQGAAALDPVEAQQRLLELLGRRPAAPVGGWTQARVGLLTAGSENDPWEARQDRALSVFGSGSGATLRWIPVELRSSSNSARPWGINDGPVWQGKGITSSLSGGLVAEWRGFTATLNPVLWSASNDDFALSPLATSPGLSPYSYPTRSTQRIDAPQRFGDASIARLEPGQSSLTYTAGKFVMGVSSATQRWGPARRNPVILSQHAAGFEHAFIGTSSPVDVRVGRVHAQWLWGRLSESDFFDTVSNNGNRFITGATFSFFPKFAPGLELGANRMFVARWRDGGPTLRQTTLIFIPLPKSAFEDPINNPVGDDELDQLASVFARWVAPDVGFEVYGEWARGDHSSDLRDFTVQPEHASGFVLGFQKTFREEERAFWHFGGEATLLGATRTSLARAPRTAFYQHHLITQGYTQRGQVIGAAIGPGSSQISIDLGRVAEWGRASITLQRTAIDNDRFYGLVNDNTWFNRNESESAVIVEALAFRGSWELGGSFAAAKLFNKGYVLRNDETNVQIGLLARYRWR
jgi:hypothetical protein